MSEIYFYNGIHNNKTSFYPQDTPIEENQSSDNTQNPGVKTIYKTPKNTFNCIVCPLGTIVGIIFYSIFTFIYIIEKQKEILIGLIVITILMIGFVGFSGFTPLYKEIIVDPVNNIIKNKIKKLCCCFSKTKIYKINEVKKIIIDKDESVHYTINYVNYDAFKVEFLLENNQVETIFTGIIDKNNESRNVFNVFRNALPNIQYLNQIDTSNILIENVKSLNDIPHKFIKQINSNEFYIKKKTNKCTFCLIFIVSGGFLAILILALLFGSDKNKSVGRLIFGIALFGFIFCIDIYAFIFEVDSLTFYLEEDSIKIKIIRNCCCLPKNIILNHGDIQRFDTESRSKSQSIFYINNLGEKTDLICLDFYGDEASYLVNVLNKYLNY